MHLPDTATHWLKHWLYDWGGANVDLFLAIHRALPDSWLWLPVSLSAMSSYWAAPAVVFVLLFRYRIRDARGPLGLNTSLYTFMLGFAVAFSVAALTKAVFALPRPFELLGDAVYRAASAPDSRYTMPSGHSVYAGVLAALLWPTLGWFGRVGLLLAVVAIGWSRVVLGAHFPVDVVAGLAIGWGCVALVALLAMRLSPQRSCSGVPQRMPTSK